MSKTFHTRAVMRAALALVPLALLATSGQAQSWPEKTIKLISPSSPGGPPDVYARALAESLGKSLGQAVIVENMPAAGGMIAANFILRAPADGYTLLINTAGMMTITPNANPKAAYKGADFAQICQGVEAELVLAGHPSIGARSYADLAKWIKSQKTPPSYSSYSPGTPAHFLGYQLGEALNVEMIHVPYKSSPPQVTDMIGGVSPLGFVQIGTAAPHVKAGKLVAYATTGSRRAAAFPDLPTMAELGLPQMTATVWFGLSGPKGLSADIVNRLTDAHQQALRSPEFKARMATAGLSAVENVCGAAFSQKISAETAQWGRVVKATGFVAGN